jgi:hypothetical protein
MMPTKLIAMDSPDCDFKATVGDSVTLQIQEVPGGGFIDFEAGTSYLESTEFPPSG